MAPSKRRGARTNQQPQQNSKNSPHESGSRSNSPDNSAVAEPAVQPGDDDSCPGCTPTSRELMKGSKKESWIGCDNCKTWYHWRCVGNGEDVGNISKWCVQPGILTVCLD